MDKCFVLHTGQSFIAHQTSLQGIIIRNSHPTTGSAPSIAVVVAIASIAMVVAIAVVVTIASMVVVGFSAAEE